MNDTERIVQIIAGTGWNAVYAMENGQEEAVPLVAWALLANGEVRPIDADRHGCTEFVRDVDNFLRLEAART